MLKLGIAMSSPVFHLRMIFVFATLASSAQAEKTKESAFLNNYYVKCHETEKHKGDVRLDQQPDARQH